MKNLFARSLGLLGFWTVAALSGCGGASGGTCANAAACGGDIVGTWKVTSSCVDVDVSAVVPADCPNATVKAVGVKVAGTETFTADFKTSGTTTVSGGMEMTLPGECLMASGITLTCAQVTAAVTADPTSPFKTLSCASSGSGCKCSGTFPDDVTSFTGTYTTTAAGLLTETDSTNQVDESDYCVKGTTLTLAPHAGAGMMGMGSLMGTVTLTKQ